jgi:cellulose synthase/poly-beta-1,6-N-acetylglucosamine synthase-like glycosyltransferase
MLILFYISLGVIFYAYFGYPLLLMFWKLVGNKPIIKKDILPMISVLISVHNEERHVEEKVKNLLDSDYPRDKMEIVVGCDGSTDRTLAIIERLAAEKKIRSCVSPERIGKPAMLNRLAREAGGEIFVFADARQRFDRRAIRELVRCFGDESVGCASGELIIEDTGEGSGRGVGLYWSYEVWLRKMESDTGSMLGATGAIYAVRREFFHTLPEDVLLDDIFTPLNAIMAKKRAVFESSARAFDVVSESTEKEFTRKVRTLAGNFQIFSLFAEAFNPFRSPIAWQLFSHKFLRLTLSYFLALFFVSSVFLARAGLPYLVILLLQVAFYALAAVGHLLERTRTRVSGVPRLVYIPYEFCVLNAAAVVALFKHLSGGADVRWDK